METNIASPQSPTAPPEVTVVLTNRALSYLAQGRVVGYSGTEYGQSVFEGGAHVCRMPLSEWRKCKDDVTLCPLRWPNSPGFWVWEVDFEIPENATAPHPTEAGATGDEVLLRVRNAITPEQLEALVCTLSPMAQAVFQRGKELREASDF